MHTFSHIIDEVNGSIEALSYPAKPEGLYEPVAYVLSNGGKRIRPVFLLLAYRLFGDDHMAAMPAAVGIETYHNYTLLHDDLMDRAGVRRGRPTVHRVWDDNTAILSGDTMLVLAYRSLMSCKGAHREAFDLFTRTALEIGEGQQFDMNFEKRTDVAEAEYIEMIRLKTSVLVACAAQMGAMLAGAKTEDAETLYRFGEQIGLAFQLQDDYLDVYGSPETFGKKIGGDILCNKKTFLAINALNRADEATRSELLGLFSPEYAGNPADKIAAVTHIYNRLGIRELCHTAIEGYYTAAEQCLERVNAPQDRKADMWEFAKTLLNRNS